MAGFLVFFEKVGQTELGGCPNVGFETLANDLAPDLDPAIVVAVADVLQQVWHFRKRAPLSVLGQVSFSLSGARFCICSRLHNQKVRDTKSGYKKEIEESAVFTSH